MAPASDRLLSRLLIAHRGQVTAYLLIAVLGALVAILLPMAVAAAVDAALGPVTPTTTLVLAAALIATVTFTELSMELLEAWTSARCTAWLRRGQVSHVVRLDLRGQRQVPSGDVLSRVLQSSADVSQLPSAMASSLTSGLTSIGGIVALLLIDVWVGLVFLLGAPLVWLLAKGFLRQTAGLTEDYQRAQGQLTDRFLGAMSGIRTIRAAGSVDREVNRVLAPLPALRASGLDLWRAQRDVGWRLALIGPALQVGVLATAGYGVLAGRVSPGSLAAVSGYLIYAFGIFRQVNVLASLGRVRGAGKRVRELLAIPAAVSGTAIFPRGNGSLRLRGVRVANGERTVLDNVDLTIPAGFAVAVVGASGEGKSTLAAVAGGLLQPDAGSVCVDGVDLADADPAELRRVIGYAFERPVLLGDTVADALRYGDRDDIYADQLASALRSSRADLFVARLPNGLDTPLAQLRASGGEFQRLGLARAFCRDARVLVLDDALSSVDTATEWQITRALAEIRCTRVIVAHRMSTAARADLVVWLRHGRVATAATHRDLLTEPGYRELFGRSHGEVTT